MIKGVAFVADSEGATGKLSGSGVHKEYPKKPFLPKVIVTA
jgi:hypothetical protein